jgi:hypothetical protein
MSGHSAPFYCAYCGDEDIRPHGTSHGEWRCNACTRVWTLKLLGLGAPLDPTDGTPGPVEVAR